MKLKRITAVLLSLSLILSTVLPTLAQNNSVRATSFTADFSTTDGWSGKTEKIDTTNKGFKRGWQGETITTVDKFNFGTDFDASVDLQYSWPNNNVIDAETGIPQTNKEVLITIGKLEIEIANWQSEIAVRYDGNDINGTPTRHFTGYRKSFTCTYDIKVKNGVITVTSYLTSLGNTGSGTFTQDQKMVEYSGTIAGFEAVNDASVALTWISGNKVTESGSYIKNLQVKQNISEEPEKASSFTADFSAASTQWEGDLTGQLGYSTDGNKFGNAGGWNNAKGSIVTKDSFDFGSKLDAEFSLYTYYANGNKNKTGEQFYVSIGKLKIAICDVQTRIEVYYDGTELTGANEAKGDTTYPSNGKRDFTYTVHVENGSIVVESDLIKYTATIDNFAAVNDAKVEVTINENSAIHTEYFSSLTVNMPSTPTGPGQSGNTENDWSDGTYGGTQFESDFSNASLWSGELVKYINTENKRFAPEVGWKNDTGKVYTTKWYNFGETLDLQFELYTYYANDSLKKDPVRQQKANYSIEVGKFKVDIINFQNAMALYYDGELIGEAKAKQNNYDKKDYTYTLKIEKDAIVLTQFDGMDEMLKIQTSLKNYEAFSKTRISISVLENSQIHQGYFSLVTANAEGEEVGYDWSDSAYGGTQFESDFSNASLWSGELVKYINTEKKRLAPEDGWKNETGKVYTTKWYNFGDEVNLKFNLFTYYVNNSVKNNPDRQKSANYSVELGKFKVDIINFQNAMALYYDGELIGEAKAKQNNYDKKSYSYLLRIEKDGIILKQVQGTETVLEIKANLKNYEGFSQSRVSLQILESSQIWTGYFSYVSATPIKNYKVLHSFNAKNDIKNVLAAEDPATALYKSQWNVLQRNNDFTWMFESIVAKQHITGFQKAIPTEPGAIPVVQTVVKSYASEIGLYNDDLFLKATFTDGKKRTTALSFEAPASGTIRLHDPEFGLIAIVNKMNGANTWCMNNDDAAVKSCYIAIYKNNEKIWPQDKSEFLFANRSHKEVSEAITYTSFPDLLIDVKQGDMIYITVRPDHYQTNGGKILSQNPTVISMNPQVDYIKITSDMKLNTDRELPKAGDDNAISVSSRITTKSAVFRALEEMPNKVNWKLVFAGVASGVFVAFMSGATVYVIKRKRRTAV